jgi:hypothetical protein
MGSIITAIIIVMICLLPVVLMTRRHKRKEKELLKSLCPKPGKEANISKYDSWSNAAIGIDVNSDIVFFTKNTGDDNINQQVMLGDIEQCKIVRINSGESSRNKAIEKLELFFIPKTKEKAVNALNFYNAEYDGPTLAGELQLAEKWCSIINERLAIARKL